MNPGNIGARIKELRQKKTLQLGKRYTGQMLADEIGISRSYLGDIESGRTTPNDLVLSKIADVFDVDIYDIIGENTNIEIDNTPSKEELSKQKLNSIIKRIDNESSIKDWIKSSDFKESLYRFLESNETDILKNLRDSIEYLAKEESNIFKSISNIKSNQYSWEANKIERNFISNHYNLLIDKIMLLLNLELTKYSNKNEINHLTPIAAHDKDGDFTPEDYNHDNALMDDDDLWNK